MVLVAQWVEHSAEKIRGPHSGQHPKTKNGPK